MTLDLPKKASTILILDKLHSMSICLVDQSDVYCLVNYIWSPFFMFLRGHCLPSASVKWCQGLSDIPLGTNSASFTQHNPIKSKESWTGPINCNPPMSSYISCLISQRLMTSWKEKTYVANSPHLKILKSRKLHQI